MAQRVQAPDLQTPAPLQPAAAPTDNYFKPNIARPQMRNVLDFGPLSDTIRKLMVDNMEGQGAIEVGKGEALQQLDPQAAEQLTNSLKGTKTPEEIRDAFGQLVREGKLHEAGSPLFQMGFAMASARQVVSAYSAGLHARVYETTMLTDQATGLPTKAHDPAAIKAEEWQKIADNPALQNFYGQQVAGKLKEQADKSFDEASASGRADAIRDQTKAYVASELATEFDHLRGQETIEPADIKRVTDFITANTREINMLDSRDVVWSGLKLHLRNVANTYGAKEALRMFDVAADLPVGGLALGKDAHVGDQMQAMKHALMQQQEEDANQVERTRATRLRDARLSGQEIYDGALADAVKSGINLLGVRAQLDDALNDKQAEFGEFLPIVRGDMYDKVQALSRENRSDPNVIGRLGDLFTHGKIAEAATLFDASIKSGALTGADVLQQGTVLNTLRNVAPKMEDHSYLSSMSKIHQAGELGDFEPSVKAKYGQRLRDLEDDFTSRRVSLVTATMGQPDQDVKLQEFDRNETGKAIEKLGTYEATIRESAGQAQDTISDLSQQHLDASSAIESYYLKGSITRTEREQYRQENRRATDRTAWFQTGDVREGLQNIDAEIAKATEIDDTQKRALSDGMRRRYEALWNQKLDEKLPKTDPAGFQSMLRETANETADEVMGQIGAGAKAQATAAIAKGETGTTVAAEQVRKDADLSAARQWEKQIDANPSALLTSNPLVQAKSNPLVPQRVLDSYVRLIQNPRAENKDWAEGKASVAAPGQGLFGGTTFYRLAPYDRALDDVGRASLLIMDQTATASVEHPERTDEQRRDAVVAAYSFVGMRPEYLLNDKIVVQRAPAVQERVRATLATYPDIAKLDTNGSVKRDFLTPITVDIKGAKINPYTTPIWRNVAELDDYRTNRPGDFKKILTRLGIPEDRASVQDFVGRQINLLVRIGAR